VESVEESTEDSNELDAYYDKMDQEFKQLKNFYEKWRRNRKG
jgi:hypothetical protein